ncbi:sensor histidine kinase [Tepidibacter formicigenes]|jgi:sensor histidine kinase YesM|uniref:HAMP domain-containing protein n=1 Tax=Tepidibacter formicigenes DSM 15518 TaxID=1123349 RepID=A0A1M6NFJ6_9FIRM|nr:sensor histidine kinase [Tepidibacter formicigenes]SHJ94467.1 HAMP domain-containing protein [Tepidibacter formicigenes DSM 15518]
MKSKFVSIKEKLIVSYLIIIIISAWISSYSIYIIYDVSKEYNNLIENIFILNKIQVHIIESKKNLDKFLLTRSRDYIDEIYYSIDDTKFSVYKFQNKRISEQNYMRCKDLYNMIYNYENYCEDTFRIALSSYDESYMKNYNNANKVYGYILKVIGEINNNLFEDAFINYNNILKYNQNLIKVLLFMVIFISSTSLIFTYVFSMKIVKSINSLTKGAKQVASGNFNIEKININSNDEVGILSKAFNKMVENIKNLLEEIKKKTELEKEAHFLALQSQINPHFLFNTLNVIAKTSLIEGADKTCDLIESLSDILRYNLRKIDSSVQLKEEIRNLKEYIHIQKTRFLDRVEFIEEIDESILGYKIPSLTIQPIVENSFMHGLEGKEDKGIIKLIAKDEKEYIHIKVIDNGKGFDLDYKNKPIKKGHTTGIGLNNIKERLNIFFKGKSEIYIKNLDEGCLVGIKIPKVGDVDA